MSFPLINKALFIDFDSTFIKVETIDELAKFHLRDKPSSYKVLKEIESITNQAMDGDISFSDALDLRLSLLELSVDDIKKMQNFIGTLISDSFVRNKDLIRSMSDSIWILSGGFTDIIVPVVAEYGIQSSHVIANTFTYSSGYVTGCEEDNPMAKDKGKVKAIESLNLGKDIIMIGDGYTDYEVYSEGASKAFICYTENVLREKVVKLSTLQADSFDSMVQIVKSL